MRTKRRPLDVSSLVWGLFFLMLAMLGGWVAIRGFVNWAVIRITGPLILIVIGIIGLRLSRPRR